MKKILGYFLIIILSGVIFVLSFNYSSSNSPKTYYNVYLDDELIGMIEKKEELEDYINSQADTIRDNVRNYTLKLDSIDALSKVDSETSNLGYSKENTAKYVIDNKSKFDLSDLDIDNIQNYLDEKLYELSEKEIDEMRDYVSQNSIYLSVDNVYTPNGIEIEKVYTYNKDIKDVKEVYKEIASKRAYSIAGYVFNIKSNTEGIDDLTIYTTDKEVFSSAIESLITIFVDDDKYDLYKSNNQKGATVDNPTIDNIYVKEDITYKAVNIPVDEKIYTSSQDLSAYLLYGDNFEEKTVEAKVGDDIETIAFNNKISVQEFLLFNTQYQDRYNMVVPGTQVTIAKIDPKIQIVVEKYEISKKDTAYDTIEKYDPNIAQGRVIVTQEGVNGEELVTQNVQEINGQITYVDPISNETVKNSIPKIVTIGTKYIPNVGSLTSWLWPTNPGYTLSSYYGYRLQVFGEGNFHSGIDIAGTGYGSPVRAANNGTIQEMRVLRDKNGNYYSYGIYVLINHNNGYYSLYGHMSRFNTEFKEGSTVSRGDIIGYVGSTGWATGPHLHFEIRTCAAYSCTTNPLKFY